MNYFKSGNKGSRVNVTAVAVGGSRVMDMMATPGSIIGICTIDLDYVYIAATNSSFDRWFCNAWGSCSWCTVFFPTVKLLVRNQASKFTSDF